MRGTSSATETTTATTTTTSIKWKKKGEENFFDVDIVKRRENVREEIEERLLDPRSRVQRNVGDVSTDVQIAIDVIEPLFSPW